jgi:photosystem II stability/assembly factor-like uncharacterized protein
MKPMALLFSTILLLSTILLFSPQQSASQWARTAGPEGGRAERLLTTASSILFALDGGAIYRSTDHGTTWATMAEALSNVSDGYGGLILAGSTVYAATYNSGVFRSTNDGLTWTSASGGLATSALHCGAIAATGDTLVITSFDGMYRSTNGGSLWVKTNTGMPADTFFNALSSAGTTFFAGSDEGAGVFASTDRGTTWYRSSNGLSGQGQNILCFAATGGSLVAGTRQGVFRSTNNGAAWTLCSSGLTNISTSALYAWGADLWAGTYGAGVYRSTNGGVDWVRTTGKIGNNNVRALTSAGTDLLAGTYGPGVVYRTSNTGTTWTGVGKGITCDGVQTMAVHAGKILGAAFSGFVLSTNQGSAWGPADSAVSANSAYALLSRTSDAFVGTMSRGVYRSTDGAATWFAANTGLDGNARSIWSLAADVGNLYAGTASGVFRSTNNGGQWSQATQGIPDSVIRRVTAHNGTAYAGTFNSLYRSTDSGQNWTVSATGLPQYFQPEAFAVVDSFVFVATFSGVYRTSNRGELWTTVSTGLPAAPDVRSLASVQPAPPGAKMLFAGLSHGGVYRSADRGDNWVYVGTGLAAGINVYSLAADQTFLFAGTYAQGVWRRPFSEMVVSVDDGGSVPGGFVLEQNFPNPFNPVTTLVYAVAGSGRNAAVGRESGAGESRVRLAVYDLLGREVAVLVDGKTAPGIYSVTFDAGALASGVYVYRLVAGPYVASRKMILTR